MNFITRLGSGNFAPLVARPFNVKNRKKMIDMYLNELLMSGANLWSAVA